MYKRILAAAIIILIAFAYVQWGMDYIYAYEWDKTAPDRASLVNDIANTRKIIGQPVDFDETLTQKLADLQDRVARETEKFPQSVDITDVVNSLLQLAQDTGIEIIPLRNGDWSKSREQGYAVYQIQLIVAGDIDDIVTFVDNVEDNMLYSINIEALDVKGESIGSAGGTAGANAVEGFITITVYKRS
jgi:Tfp pilus assembly protein PilO